MATDLVRGARRLKLAKDAVRRIWQAGDVGVRPGTIPTNSISERYKVLTALQRVGLIAKTGLTGRWCEYRRVPGAGMPDEDRLRQILWPVPPHVASTTPPNGEGAPDGAATDGSVAEALDMTRIHDAVDVLIDAVATRAGGSEQAVRLLAVCAESLACLHERLTEIEAKIDRLVAEWTGGQT